MGNTRALDRQKQLRTAGIILLLIGIVSSGLVYLLGTRSPDTSDDIVEMRDSKAQTRAIEMNLGKLGPIMYDTWAALKRPGPQAAIILATGAVVAAICFYLASCCGRDPGPDSP